MVLDDGVVGEIEHTRLFNGELEIEYGEFGSVGRMAIGDPQPVFEDLPDRMARKAIGTVGSPTGLVMNGLFDGERHSFTLSAKQHE